MVVLPRDDSRLTGLELLREIAVARVAGPPSARVRIDWTRCGLELAQVGLGFGANELAGHIASKRGLPFAEGEQIGVGKRSRLQAADLVKKKELAGFVRRSGRIPVFVGADGSVDTVDEALSISGENRCSTRLSKNFTPASGCRSTTASRSSATPTSFAVGQPRQRGSRAAPRRSHVLQPEHAHRGDQRLRRVVPLLLVRKARRRSPRRAHDDARGGLARARGAHGRSPERDPHRQRPSPGPAVLLLRGASRRLQAHQARRPLEVLHGRRDPLLRDALRNDVPRGPRAAAGRRAWTAFPAAAPKSSTPTVRTRIAHDKATADECLEVHRVAHGLGISTNATMLYGHIETFEHRVDHLVRLRALQDETGGFQAFIPLAFHPDGNGMRNLPAPTAIDALRTVAVSRLLLDNVPHIKAYWVSMTPEVAQIALCFGADDIDGTIVHETIYRAAGTRSPGALTARADRSPHPRSRTHSRRARVRSTTCVREHPRASMPEAAIKVRDRKATKHLEVLS